MSGSVLFCSVLRFAVLLCVLTVCAMPLPFDAEAEC